MDMHQVDVMRARIYFLETALAAMTAERDSLKDAVHFLNTMNDEQDEWFTRIADDHGGWHEDLPTGEAHIEESIGKLKEERDARDVAIGVLGEEVRVYRMHVGLCNAVNSRGWIVLSRLQRGTVASNLWSDAVRAVNANALARAAVEGER